MGLKCLGNVVSAKWKSVLSDDVRAQHSFAGVGSDQGSGIFKLIKRARRDALQGI